MHQTKSDLQKYCITHVASCNQVHQIAAGIKFRNPDIPCYRGGGEFKEQNGQVSFHCSLLILDETVDLRVELDIQEKKTMREANAANPGR